MASPEDDLSEVSSSLLTRRDVPVNTKVGPPRGQQNRHGDDDDDDEEDSDEDSDTDFDSDGDTDQGDENSGLKGAGKPKISGADAAEKLSKMDADGDLSRCPRYKRCAGECCTHPDTPKKDWSRNAEECVHMEGRKVEWKWHTCCEKGKVADMRGRCCGKGKVVNGLCTH